MSIPGDNQNEIDDIFRRLANLSARQNAMGADLNAAQANIVHNTQQIVALQQQMAAGQQAQAQRQPNAAPLAGRAEEVVNQEQPIADAVIRA